MENATNFIQTRFLNNVRNKKIKLYLLNKCVIEGTIIAEDNYCLLIRPIDSASGSEKVETNLIFKSAIVNISVYEKITINTSVPESTTQNKNNNNNNNKTSKKNHENSTFTNTPNNQNKPQNNIPIMKESKAQTPEIKSKDEPVEFDLPSISSMDKIDKEDKIEENKKEDYSIHSFLDDLNGISKKSTDSD